MKKFTAADANELSSGKGSGMNAALKKVYDHIKFIASTGKKEATVASDSITPAIKTELENDGYSVKFVSDSRDGDFYSIKW